MSASEVDFLRDEVKRLNEILSTYQEKYPPLTPNANQGSLPDIPWRTDPNLMSPLLAEYDANLQQLTESVDKETIRSLRQQMQQVVGENERLRRELKESVQSQLEGLSSDALTPLVGDGDDVELLENMQKQLQTVKVERDSMEEMWKASEIEVERLEQALQNAKANPGLQKIEAQANQIKNQYMATVAELNSEITSLQEELRATKSELNISNIQVAELRAAMEDLKIQLMQQEQERAFASGSKEKCDGHVATVTRKLAETQSRLDRMEHELNLTKKEKSSIEKKSIELQEKIADLEQREYEASNQVRDSIQMVETAMLEKDQAIQKERQTAEDLQNMEATLAKLVDEAGARTRQEVDNIKKQANQNLSRLMEEIHNLEMENSEKQAQIDRAVREKRAVESELEKIYQEGLVQGTKDMGTYDELNRRACNAERTRDEALLKLDSMENNMRRLEMNFKQDKGYLQAEVNQLKDRLQQMNNEFELVSDDRVTLVEKMDEIKKKMCALQQERDSAVRTRKKEVACLQNDFQLKEIEFEAKIQSLEDGHRSSLLETRQMLASQQRMTAKWKEECQTITQKFETKLNDLRSELSREKKRVTELTKLLRESKDKTADVEQMLAEYTYNLKRMEDRVRDAENRAADAHVQHARALKKDRNIVEERRQMQRQLERSLAESKIGSSGVAEPLALSDLGGAKEIDMHR